MPVAISLGAAQSGPVVCLGELLIDLVSLQPGAPLAEVPAFAPAPGGAPGNVAVGLARLGAACAFLGKVGDDAFGRLLARALRENGVDTAPLRFTRAARTGLAFVALAAGGEREFMFYRHPSADMLLTPEELDEGALQAASIFHFGSLTLISEPARSATLRAALLARSAGALISYDPNLRLDLWPSPEEARRGILRGWQEAQVIKVSAEELTFLAETDDLAAAARALRHEGLRLLVATEGARGCAGFTASESLRVPGFAVEAVDTTGAGDAFVAGLLYRILQAGGLDALLADRAALLGALRFANAAGALAATRRGAMPALPTLAEVEALLTAP